MSGQTAREAYVANQVRWYTDGAHIDNLMDNAVEYGVRFDDNTKIEVLAELVANNDWYKAVNTRNPQPPFGGPVPEHYSLDLLPLDDEEDEDGPTFSRAELLSRFVGAIGGTEYVMAQRTPEARIKAKCVKALDAVLAGVELESVNHVEQAKADVRAVYGFDDMESGAQTLRDEVTSPAEPVGPQPKTVSAWFIYEVLLPEFLEHFFAKNAEYGDRHRMSNYGPAGELIGIDRKMDKLREALWNGKELQFEQPKEMLFDVIGSAFLALDILALQKAEETEA